MIAVWACYGVMVAGMVAAKLLYGSTEIPDDALPEWRLVAGDVAFVISVGAAFAGVIVSSYWLGSSS